MKTPPPLPKPVPTPPPIPEEYRRAASSTPRPPLSQSFPLNLLIHSHLGPIIKKPELEWMDNYLDDGTHILVHGLDLVPMVMDMFDIVVVAKMPDGSIVYDFISKKYAPSKEMIDIIAKLYRTHGPDKYGQGACTPVDTIRLKEGKFGRHWKNVDILQVPRAGCIGRTMAMRITVPKEDV